MSRFLGDCSRESFRIVLEQEARCLEVLFSKNALPLVVFLKLYASIGALITPFKLFVCQEECLPHARECHSIFLIC